MNLRQMTYLIKFDLSQLRRFQQRCFGCHSPISLKGGFTYHHLKYKYGEKSYADFKVNGKYTPRSSYDYMKYLAPIIRKEPQRFLLLCRGCHHFLERLNKFGDPRLKRLMLARRWSRK